MILWISISMLILIILRSCSSFFSSTTFELYHVFIIFLALNSSYWEGFIFSLLAGYIIGSLSAFPSGEYAFSFSILFSIIYLLKNILNPENKWLWVLLPFTGTFLNWLFAGFIRAIAGLSLEIHYGIFLNAILSVFLLNFMNYLFRRKNAVPST